MLLKQLRYKQAVTLLHDWSVKLIGSMRVVEEDILKYDNTEVHCAML